MKFGCLLLLVLPVSAETLHYVINWPSGLSLGEATLEVGKTEHETWNLGFDLDASVPGFAIRDKYQSKAAGSGLCSVELTRTVQRGSRKSQETDTFDQESHSVTRQTKAPGGKSGFSIQDCARDALSFLQYTRSELASGRLVPQQRVVLGGTYDVRLEFSGEETVQSNGKPVQADRIQAAIKGPASEFTLQVLFAKDAARTPVLVRIPLSLGTFTAELTH